MSLDECMQKTTHRVYLAWIDWLDEQFNHPSKSDNYLMQIAQTIRQVLHKKPASVKLSHFVLKFKKEKPQTPQDKKMTTKQSKFRWFGWVSGSKR